LSLLKEFGFGLFLLLFSFMFWFCILCFLFFFLLYHVNNPVFYISPSVKFGSVFCDIALIRQIAFDSTFHYNILSNRKRVRWLGWYNVLLQMYTKYNLATFCVSWMCGQCPQRFLVFLACFLVEANHVTSLTWFRYLSHKCRWKYDNEDLCKGNVYL
jgi:hypothetical protein